MAELERRSLALGTVLYLAVMTGIMVLRLLPLNTSPTRWPMPDVMLVLTCLYAVRAPRSLPVAVIALVFVGADFLFQRPPGLMAAAVVLGTETLRRQSHSLRAGTLVTEWISAALVIAAVTLLSRVALTVMLAPRPALVPDLLVMAQSILIYPAVAVLGQWGLGLRRHPVGELDYRGQKI